MNFINLGNYTFPNYLWESPLEHGNKAGAHFKAAWQKPNTGNLLAGLGYLCITLVEACPLLGQIASTIEIITLFIFNTFCSQASSTTASKQAKEQLEASPAK